MTTRERLTVTSPDGTPISFVRSGAGSPVLLVHGGGADGSSLVLIARALAARHTVLLMDRRGRTAPIEPSAYTIELEYDDICAVAASAGEPVHVFGHSYGGLCTLGAVLKQPDLFRAVTLYEPPIPTPGEPVITEDLILRVDESLERGDGEAAALAFLRDGVKVPEHELALWRSTPAWGQVVRDAHVFRWEGRNVRAYTLDAAACRGIAVPVTLLLGSENHPQYRAATEALARAIPHARVVTLEGQWHLATAFAPDAIARAIEEVEA